MERSTLISATVAAALHGLVLFGFGSKADGRTRGAPERKPAAVVPRPVATELPEEVIALRPADPSTDTETAAAPPPAPAPAAQPEPPAMAAADPGFVIEVPPTRADVDPGLITIPERRFDFVLPGRAGPGGGGGSIAASGELDNPPRTRLQAAPVFPYEARRNGLGGEVVLEFVVDESGRVRDVRVVRASHPVFEDAAVRAVARWVFEPGRRHGRIVPFRMAVPIVFNVGD